VKLVYFTKSKEGEEGRRASDSCPTICSSLLLSSLPQACGVLSTTGTSHPFDESLAQGYIRAEGEP